MLLSVIGLVAVVAFVMIVIALYKGERAFTPIAVLLLTIIELLRILPLGH